MSASDKKKLRKEQRAAAMSEKQKREQKEAKQLKIWTSIFAVTMACVILITAGFSMLNDQNGFVRGWIYRNTTAYTINDHKLSNTELAYFYIDAINEYQSAVYEQYYSSFGNYWSLMLGFDSSKPLNEQQYTGGETAKTWADYFVEQAIDTAKRTYALYDDAMAKEHKLTDSEQKNLDSYMSSLDLYATYYGYNNVDAYLRTSYGLGANESTYKDYYKVCTYASSYLTKYSDSLEYDVEDFRAYEKEEDGRYDDYSVVSYVYYTMKYNTYLGEGTKSEDGKTTTWTDEEKAEAREKMKADMEALLAAGVIDKESFDKAIQAWEINQPKEETKNETTVQPKDGTSTDDANKDETNKDETNKDESNKNDSSSSSSSSTAKLPTATEAKRTYFASISLLEDAVNWMKETERKAGDLKAFEVKTYTAPKDTTLADDHEHGDECGCTCTIDGYTIVLFTERDNQEYKMVNVRHILVKFEGGTKDKDGKTTYSDEEKAAAKEEAEKLLQQWKDGKANEDSFSELANKESDDQNGKVTNGGLYEDIYKGQMVEAFENWCFDAERKEGDTGLVETEYGWHVMYFSSFDEMTYRDTLIEYDLRIEETEEWLDDLVSKLTCADGNKKYLPLDYTIG